MVYTTPGLKVTKRQGKATKTRKSYLISGVNPNNNFRAYNSTIVGMERAIVERLYYIKENGVWQEPPTPVKGVFFRVLKPFKDQLLKYSKRCHPLEHVAFAMCYHGPRRARYLAAAESLTEKPLDIRDARLKFFLKYETYDFVNKPNPSPRGINPRDDRYLCSLGSYLHPIEKKIFKNIAKIFGYPVVMKGYNQSERGNLLADYWDAVDDTVGVSIDASRFEQSVGIDALKWEHLIYQSFYKGDKKLRRMLKWQLRNIGRASAPDGFLSFAMDGRRMSGDKNTALGNCLLSAAMGYAFVNHLGIKIHEVRFFCDGDDAVLFVSRKHLARLMAEIVPFYRRLGFRMKVENPAYILEHVDFCQSRPVQLNGEWLMVREPHRALSKDAVSKKPLDSLKNYQRWIAAVGLGGLSTVGGVPCSQAYYKCLARNSCGAKPLNSSDPSIRDAYQYKIAGMTRKEMEIAPIARASFSLAFGVSPRAQKHIGQYYENLVLEYGIKDTVLKGTANCGW